MRQYQTTIFIFISILLGLIFPYGIHWKGFTFYLLFLLLFFNFLKLDFSFHQIKMKHFVYYGFFCWLIMPFIIYFFLMILPVKIQFIDILLVILTPTAIASAVVGRLLNADKNQLMFFIIASNLIFPLVLTLYIIFLIPGKNLNGIYYQIILHNLSILLISFLLAFLVKKIKKLYDSFEKISNFASLLLLCGIIYISSSVASQYLYAKKILDFDFLVMIGLLVFSGISFFLIPYKVKTDLASKKSLSLALGHKNSALTLWIIFNFFSDQQVIPMMLYIVIQHMINGIFIFFNQKKSIIKNELISD